MQRRTRAAILVAAAMAAISIGGRYATAEPTGAVLTDHELRVSGQVLTYTAEAGRIPIVDAATGEPHGYIFYTSYRLAGAARRPIAFVWNGGPGANSSTLHFRVAGPKIWRDGQLEDNAATWLRFADLVFVDPVGTGFSRPARREYAQEFYGTLGDVASVSAFVRDWLIQHKALDVPHFLVGESYGAGRAANVGYRLETAGIAIAGLVLISGGNGLNKDYIDVPLRSALHLKELNTVAAFHKKAPLASEEELDRFARDVYAPALADPAALSTEQRQAVIAKIVHYTGLAADKVDPATLRVTPRGFRMGLLASEGKVLNVFDMRRTSDIAEPDPALLMAYLRDTLGYDSELPYLGTESADWGYLPAGELPADPGETWDYATAKVSPEEIAAAIKEAERTGDGPPRLGPPLPAVPDALGLNPELRIFIAAGRDDSLNSCAANEETAKDLPERFGQAVGFHCYEGGHMMYLDENSRSRLFRDLATFFAATATR